MASTLQVVTELKEDYYLITATVQPGGTLPAEIFIYENNGSNVLGSFFGTCSFEELGRFQIFNNVAIPTFGNKYYRYGEAKIKVALTDDPVSVVVALTKNVTALSTALQTKITVSQNFIIP